MNSETFNTSGTSGLVELIKFIYCDATRDNSKFKLFHQQQNFVYSKTTFALGRVTKSIPTRLLIY